MLFDLLKLQIKETGSFLCAEHLRLVEVGNSQLPGRKYHLDCFLNNNKLHFHFVILCMYTKQTFDSPVLGVKYLCHVSSRGLNRKGLVTSKRLSCKNHRLSSLQLAFSIRRSNTSFNMPRNSTLVITDNDKPLIRLPATGTSFKTYSH